MKNPSFSRRNFLQSGAVAAACAATGTLAALSAVPAVAEAIPAAGKPSPIRLGLCSYTFRNFTRVQMIGYMQQLHVTDLNCKDAKDHLPGLPETVAAKGATPASVQPADPAAEQQALADYAAAGIKVHAVGAIYFPVNDENDIRSKFEYAKRAGVGVIVAGDPTPDSLKWIERFVKEYDIRIAIHNHGPEDKFFPSPFEVLKVVNDMDPRIGLCIDIGHASRAGANLVEAIHAAGPRLYDIHAKDLLTFDRNAKQVAVGQGIMPIREIFEALIAINYQGYVDLEYEINGDNPMPGTIESMAFMRGVLRGMGYLTKTAAA